MSKMSREAMQERNQLAIIFKTTGNNFQINIPNVRLDVTEEEIKAIAEKVIEGQFFAPNGDEVLSMVKAKVIATETNRYDLVI